VVYEFSPLSRPDVVILMPRCEARRIYAVRRSLMTILRTFTCAALLVLVSTPASSQPGPATLISPAADVSGSTIAFSWHHAPNATWYHFWLGKSDTSLVMEQWYTAEHAGCAVGGTCTVTVTPPIGAGAFVWHIRTWAPAGYGPWSTAHLFTVNDVVQAWSVTLPPSRRFTVVMNGQGVLDHETGLVWQRTPGNGTVETTYPFSLRECAVVADGGRRGWRVPTLSEMQSLMDLTRTDPSLPPGHPFVTPTAPRRFWTQTLNLADTSTNWVADFTDHNFFGYPHDGSVRVWCVRGGNSNGQ
jgi:hypothetical protein